MSLSSDTSAGPTWRTVALLLSGSMWTAFPSSVDHDAQMPLSVPTNGIGRVWVPRGSGTTAVTVPMSGSSLDTTPSRPLRIHSAPAAKVNASGSPDVWIVCVIAFRCGSMR